MFYWQWSPDSKTESSLLGYYLARAASLVWLALLAAWVPLMVWNIADGGMDGQAAALPFLLMAALVLWIRHLVVRYVAHLRITEDGLAVRKGATRWVQPWQTVGAVRPVRFVISSCWQLSFTDGTPPIAFFTGGSSISIFGYAVSRSVFVEELKKRIGTASGA
jgi:hypothetical protein